MDIQTLKGWYQAQLQDTERKMQNLRIQVRDKRCSPHTRDQRMKDLNRAAALAQFHAEAVGFLSAMGRQHLITHGESK